LRSDWPHPSFGGRFLPTKREVGDSGFTAQWAVSALATAAPREALSGGRMCTQPVAAENGRYEQSGTHVANQSGTDKPCLDTLSVSFIDPVNPYTLSDRAIKYGLLFVLLTYTALGLAEALAGESVRRMHPVQYALARIFHQEEVGGLVAEPVVIGISPPMATEDHRCQSVPTRLLNLDAWAGALSRPRLTVATSSVTVACCCSNRSTNALV
jgi:hypothetical protein